MEPVLNRFTVSEGNKRKKKKFVDESFVLNTWKFTKGNERKKKQLGNKSEGHVLWEPTVKKEAQLLKWDEYLLAERYKVIRNKLQSYYKDFFPFEDMCTWLCYGKYISSLIQLPFEISIAIFKADSLQYREFSYVMLPKRFRRYKTFDHFREMKFEIYKVCPVKIDIGAIFNMRPTMDKDRKSYPIERELIFDIDLSDYNTIRSCCNAETICQKCWKFVAVAVKIMHTSFLEDFGWKHILWVFSGRRGIHCWVCDPDARRLSSEQREQILKYYRLEKPGLICDVDDDNDDLADYVHNKDEDVDDEKDEEDEEDEEVEDDDFEDKTPDRFGHKHVGRSWIFAKRCFIQVCLQEQDILRTSEGERQFISLLPTSPFRRKVTEFFAECSTSLEKWQKFEEYWKSDEIYQTNLRKLRPHLLKHIVLWYLYPRIDVAVSKGMNHLLKAPFSFHPTSFLLCTPFDPFKVDEFKISEVPSLELFDSLKKPVDTLTTTEKIQRQRFAESTHVFSNFVQSLQAIRT